MNQPTRKQLFPLTGHDSGPGTFAPDWNRVRAGFADVGLRYGESIPGHPFLMDFSGALLALKAGHLVARDNWRAGTYVTLQVGYPAGIPINANTADATGIAQGQQCTFLPYLLQYIGSYSEIRAVIPQRLVNDLPAPAFIPWAATMVDLMAEDWRVFAKPNTAAAAAADVDVDALLGEPGPARS